MNVRVVISDPMGESTSTIHHMWEDICMWRLCCEWLFIDIKHCLLLWERWWCPCVEERVVTNVTVVILTKRECLGRKLVFLRWLMLTERLGCVFVCVSMKRWLCTYIHVCCVDNHEGTSWFWIQGPREGAYWWRKWNIERCVNYYYFVIFST